MPISLLESDLEAYDESIDEAFEDAFDDAWDEARWRPARPRLNRPGRFTPQPRPTTPFVTPAQLDAALAKVRQAVTANQNAIGQVNKSVAALGAEQRKAVSAVKAEVRQVREMSVLGPLLQSTQAPLQTGVIPPGQNFVVDRGDALTTLLPLLALSGNTGGGGGGLLGGGDSSSMLLLALALSKRG